jgi:hypothetical protein
MTPTTDRAVTRLARRHATGVVAVALVLGSLGLTGCGAIRAVKKVVSTVEKNKNTMDAFTNKIKSGEATPFEATYVTTGSSPERVVYAVDPPKGVLFKLTSSGKNNNNNSNNLDLIVTLSGEYACTPPSGSGSGSTSTWKCTELPKASAADYNKIEDFYTPQHWVTFLDDFALAAGIAGDKVSSSTLKVNGFSMSCVDFVAPGVKGTSTICTTAQDILGYVKVAQDSTSFEIKSYSPSPKASLFQLPPGATVTTIPKVTTPTT